jgi:hypothetical protein
VLTKREIFERVRDHLLRQMKHSRLPDDSNGRGACAYRGEEGRSCAVGCLIPDGLYDPVVERRKVYFVWDGTRPGDVKLREALTGAGIDVLDRDVHQLLDRLQGVHDEWDPEHWVDRLALVEGSFFERTA